MTANTIVPVDRAAAFDISELFFSTTDRAGRIKSCNDVFLRISGYSSQEMLGAPHNIVRHPDMPKCVFDLLWEYLLSGRPMGAYVKNMTKNGEHYWVYALVVPIEDGFLSVRMKPSSDEFNMVRELYGKLLSIEKGYGGNWREGMKAAGEELVGDISIIGFASYEAFMVHCLRKEILSRAELLRSRGGDRVVAKNSRAREVFGELESFDALGEEASGQSEELFIASQTIKRIALNGSVCAARMEDTGRALGVLSEQVWAISRNIFVEMSHLDNGQARLLSALDKTTFQIATSVLFEEMLGAFNHMASARSLSTLEQTRAYGELFNESSSMLMTALVESIAEAEHFRASLDSLKQVSDRFSRILLTARISHVTGRSIAASLEGGDQFSNLLNEMSAIAEDSRDGLDLLKKLIKRVDYSVSYWQRGWSAA